MIKGLMPANLVEAPAFLFLLFTSKKIQEFKKQTESSSSVNLQMRHNFSEMISFFLISICYFGNRGRHLIHPRGKKIIENGCTAVKSF